MINSDAVIIMHFLHTVYFRIVSAAGKHQSNNQKPNANASQRQMGRVCRAISEPITSPPIRRSAFIQGKHEFDGKFPDWSETGFAKEIARLKSEREKATAFKDDQTRRAAAVRA